MPIEAKITLSCGGYVQMRGDEIVICDRDGPEHSTVLFKREEMQEVWAAASKLTRWADEADMPLQPPAPIAIEQHIKHTPITREDLDRMRAEAPPADMSGATDLSEVQLSKLRSVIETTTKDGERNVYLTPGDPQRWIDAFEAMTGRLRLMNNGAFKLGTYGELWIEDARADLSHVEAPFKRQYDPEVMERG